MTVPEATLMFAEAAEASAVVARQRRANATAVTALAERLRAQQPHAVATIARGSSDHAATFAKYLIETHLGVPVSSAAPSISSVYHAAPRLAGSLLLAISQSGRSPDLLSAVEAGRDSGALVAAMVNDEASPLAAMADALLPLRAGAERSVAATRAISRHWRRSSISSRRGAATRRCTPRSTPPPMRWPPHGDANGRRWWTASKMRAAFM